MVIFHITNDFSGSKVYANLVSKIDYLGHEQVVYTALRSEQLIGKNTLEFKVPKSRIVYSNILTIYDRFFFRQKIRKIVSDINKKISVESFSVIHAHTWFSDGAVAYELFLKDNRPYLVTIRNTDLNIFWKYGFHLRGYALEILKAAASIVFVSPIYKKRFNKIISSYKDSTKLIEKCVVIPNGIDSFWLDNLLDNQPLRIANDYRFLYVGRFSKGKNLFKLVLSIIRLNKLGFHCSLSLVGNSQDASHRLKALGYKYDFINFLGEITSKDDLLQIYRAHDAFVMASLHETLGLVYMEAISQGLPVLYSMNEGIDGLFDDSIGVSVDPHKLDSIVAGLLKLIENKESYKFLPRQVLHNYNWNHIAIIYSTMYEKVISLNRV